MSQLLLLLIVHVHVAYNDLTANFCLLSGKLLKMKITNMDKGIYFLVTR